MHSLPSVSINICIFCLDVLYLKICIYLFISFCRIDNSMQVKITDNALARDLFPMDYHCLGDNENRPVRWMALESLLNNDFSSASDVVRVTASLCLFLQQTLTCTNIIFCFIHSFCFSLHMDNSPIKERCTFLVFSYGTGKIIIIFKIRDCVPDPGNRFKIA